MPPPGTYPYTRGIYPEMYRAPPLDDAPVRRVRLRRGDERAVQGAAREGADGPLGRLRPADATRLRRGRPDGGGRGRQGRRRDQPPRRHAHPLRRHPARRGDDEHDDQRARRDPAADVPDRRRGAGRGRAQAGRHDPERPAEGVSGARHLHLSAAPVDAPRHGHLRLLREVPAAVEPDQHQRLPHARGGLLGGAGDRLHARQRDRLCRGRPARRGSAWTTSRRGSPSSSARTTISSRRWRSSAPRAASGRR